MESETIHMPKKDLEDNISKVNNYLSIHILTDFQLWEKRTLFIYDGDGETVMNSYVSSVSAGF